MPLRPPPVVSVADNDPSNYGDYAKQVVYCLERVPAVVAQKPELKNREPFKTVLSGNREAMAKLS
jgi:hypothetical protein